MEGAGGGAHGGAEEACRKACPDAVAPYDGAKAGGEGYAVYVSLGGDGPGDGPAVYVAEEGSYQVQDLVSDDNGPDIFRVLPHGGKG